MNVGRATRFGKHAWRRATDESGSERDSALFTVRRCRTSVRIFRSISTIYVRRCREPRGHNDQTACNLTGASQRGRPFGFITMDAGATGQYERVEAIAADNRRL